MSILLAYLLAIRIKIVMKQRMFIALDISNPDKGKIDLWRGQHLSLPFKAINPQNLHITLAFLGFIDNIQQVRLTQLINQQHDNIQQQVKSLITQNLPLSVELSKIGYFKNAQVLHLMPTTDPDWLLCLHKQLIVLCINSNIALENSIYQPHLSLYRKSKFDSVSRLIELQEINFTQKLNITSFSLYHSYSTTSGVCYAPVHTWKL